MKNIIVNSINKDLSILTKKKFSKKYISKYILPIIDNIANSKQKKILISGSQGIGKSTFLKIIEKNIFKFYKKKILTLSLDDYYLPKKEKGEIYQRYKLSEIDLSKGDWLILTRTNPLLKPIPAFLKRKGFFFETADGKSMGKALFEDVQNWNRLKKGETLPEIQETRVRERIKEKKLTINEEWYEAFTNVTDTKKEYLRAMLMNGEDLSEEPRIKVSTIHGAKGGEATNVVLFLNQTSNTIKASKKSKAKQDEEYRVWYVGATRTIQNLYLIKCNNKQKEFSI